jgi:hypothetical protein
MGKDTDSAPLMENNANVAVLRGVTVYVKKISRKTSVVLARNDLLELKLVTG